MVANPSTLKKQFSKLESHPKKNNKKSAACMPAFNITDTDAENTFFILKMADNQHH